MFKRITRIVIATVGILCGVLLADLLNNLGRQYEFWNIDILNNNILVRYIAGGIIVALCGTLAWFLSQFIANGMISIASRIDAWQSDKSLSDLFVSLFGIVSGLLIAYLFGSLTSKIPGQALSLILTTLLYLICPYVFLKIFWRRRLDFQALPFFRRYAKKSLSNGTVKIFDASVLIDGRIFDVCKAGFIEGRIIIPDFVVDEIMHVADNDDAQKRNRGRRALDTIKKLQDELKLPMEIRNVNYDDATEYSIMLLRFAVENSATIVTTDYNLNKAALVHKIKVLNINDLTNALKTQLVPGESLTVRIIKVGKEQNQGLAYLDDGTMIVVENGAGSVGEDKTVVVSNVMQTSAGRMIFARIEE